MYIKKGLHDSPQNGANNLVCCTNESSYEPGPENLDNMFMHLTNYSINKQSEHYVQNVNADEDNFGNKWSIRALRANLKRRGIDTDLLWGRIHEIIIKTLISIETVVVAGSRMFVPHRGNCFELFGFDILVDDTLRPWLLEVNLTPSLACDSPLDLKIKVWKCHDSILIYSVGIDRRFMHTCRIP